MDAILCIVCVVITAFTHEPMWMIAAAIFSLAASVCAVFANRSKSQNSFPKNPPGEKFDHNLKNL